MNSLFDADPATAAPAWADALPPTRSAALARIARVRPAAYARTRNHLDGAVTGLSPYLTHGLVTLREVLAGVLGRGPLPVQHKLVFELGWREFFRHAWAHEGEGILQSLHPGPRADAAYARTLPDDIRQARTCVPVVDRAVQTLYATGTLHNHARMWLASYVVHLRHVHWRAGADWLVAHLADGDLASNHLSWQWVAGTGSHKPYLFNAENVARHAPPAWHSEGTVVDQPYEALDRAARAAHALAGPGPATAAATPVPTNEELAASLSARQEASPTLAPTGGSPILGVEGLEYRIGGCCSPLPGEAIVGTVALGNHGITIHRQDCANVGQVPVERRLPVRWNPAAEGLARRYPVRLRIQVLDRVGVLKDILTRLSDHRINVSDARVRTSPGRPAKIDLRVELASVGQLVTTIDQIRSMADVLDICRTGIG